MGAAVVMLDTIPAEKRLPWEVLRCNLHLYGFSMPRAKQAGLLQACYHVGFDRRSSPSIADSLSLVTGGR